MRSIEAVPVVINGAKQRTAKVSGSSGPPKKKKSKKGKSKNYGVMVEDIDTWIGAVTRDNGNIK